MTSRVLGLLFLLVPLAACGNQNSLNPLVEERAPECAQSLDCPIEAFCEGGECLSGCREDTDCLAGQGCGGECECVALPCENSYSDCSFGESCNLETGVCEPDLSGHCEPCLSDCDGGECLSWGELGDFCLIDCVLSDLESCPSGYECLDIFGESGSQGVCVADCPTVEEEGLN